MLDRLYQASATELWRRQAALETMASPDAGPRSDGAGGGEPHRAGARGPRGLPPRPPPAPAPHGHPGGGRARVLGAARRGRARRDPGPHGRLQRAWRSGSGRSTGSRTSSSPESLTISARPLASIRWSADLLHSGALGPLTPKQMRLVGDHPVEQPPAPRAGRPDRGARAAPRAAGSQLDLRPTDIHGAIVAGAGGDRPARRARRPPPRRHRA